MADIEPILKDRYEVVVIGAGIGGLSTAAVLARQGADVLLVEQSNQPGGCCSSLRMGDFTFDTAASVLNGFGHVGFHVMRTLFDFLGQQVEIIQRDSAYTLHFGETHLEFHRDRNAFTAELGALFPQQAGSVLSYIKDLEHLYHTVLDMSGPPRPSGDETRLEKLGLLTRHPSSFLRNSRLRKTSAGQLLARRVDDPAVRSFFAADAAYSAGYDIDELSAAHAALFSIDRHVGGTYHAIGSAQQIADKLEKGLNESGGRIIYRQAVEEVVVQGGRALGVRLAGGRTVAADIVVSAISVRELLNRMVPAGELKPQTVEWARALEPAHGALGIYLGVPEEIVPEGFNPNTVLVTDPEKDPTDFISVVIPSLFDPNLSPEGYHSLTVHAVSAPGSWPRHDEPEYQGVEYRARRKAEVSSVLSRLAVLLPGLEESARVKQVVTPSTFGKILGREGGAFAGPRVPGGPPSGSVTDVKGLLLAGDSTFFGKGVTEAAASGIHCALIALGQLGLRRPRFHHVRESFVLESVPVRPEISSGSVVDSVSAVLESHRCLRCPEAPCMASCPCGVDVPNFIRRISAADFGGAARLIREANVLGEVCGLVCPADALCESACRRSSIDAPLRIGQLEAFTCGYARGAEGRPAHHGPPSKGRVAVVGAGPAGLACARDLLLMGYGVELFDENIEPGGLPSRAMTDLRLDRQVLIREVDGALAQGAGFRGNLSFGDDVNLESLWRMGFSAIFIAPGLQDIEKPDVEGTELPGVIDALSFLGAARSRVKREMTSSVAVVGDGSVALDSAVLASELGARQVYLIAKGKIDEQGPAADRLAAMRERKIEMLFSREVLEITGEGRVEAIKVSPDSDAASGDSKKKAAEPRSIDVGTVILAGERVPSPALREYLAGQVKLDPRGIILIDPHTMATSRDGVFAGGEIAGARGMVVSACEHGRRAAASIDMYLSSLSGSPAQQNSP